MDLNLNSVVTVLSIISAENSSTSADFPIIFLKLSNLPICLIHHWNDISTELLVVYFCIKIRVEMARKSQVNK